MTLLNPAILFIQIYRFLRTHSSGCCRAEGSELLTAWVALSDVAADGGPMTFIRGSNKW